MIADTTFISDLLRERRRGQLGAAGRFLAENRRQTIRTSIITAGEVLLLFEDSAAAWNWLAPWTIYRLHPGVVEAAANIDRELIRRGTRLGENDNWIAGFALYYREPLISRDEGFDVAPGFRRMAY
jgi:predicted nucleic acid-binding protein